MKKKTKTCEGRVMILRAWDEPYRFTDLDLGITDADKAAETFQATVARFGDRWSWAVWRDFLEAIDPYPRWSEEVIAEGFAPTEAEAEAAGEAAKESHLRSLIRR